MWLKCSLCNKNCFFSLTPGYFLRAPDNSNLFRFPLKVRVIGSQLYIDSSQLILATIKFELNCFKNFWWGIRDPVTDCITQNNNSVKRCGSKIQEFSIWYKNLPLTSNYLSFRKQKFKIMVENCVNLCSTIRDSSEGKFGWLPQI